MVVSVPVGEATLVGSVVVFSVVIGAAAGVSELPRGLVAGAGSDVGSCSLLRTAEVWKAVGGGSDDIVNKNQGRWCLIKELHQALAAPRAAFV